LPAPAYFPFHPDSGSQTSNSMCEPGVGATTPCTRQKAANVSNAVKNDASERGLSAGSVNAPASIVSADVIVVFRSCSVETVARGRGRRRWQAYHDRHER